MKPKTVIQAPPLVPEAPPQIVLRPLSWAARRLSCSRHTLLNLGDEGHLELVRLRPGRRGPVRVTERSVDKLISEQLKQRA